MKNLDFRSVRILVRVLKKLDPDPFEKRKWIHLSPENKSKLGMEYRTSLCIRERHRIRSKHIRK